RTVTAARTISASLTNTASVAGTPPVGPPVTSTDTAVVARINPGIRIEKSTNGQDADAAPGPIVSVGTSVIWTYEVRNFGDVGITNIAVFDDQIGPITNLVSGDLNNNRVLETNEVWVFSHTGIAQSGQYRNIGSVTGVTVQTAQPVQDADPSHYLGVSAGYTLMKIWNAPANGEVFPGDSVAFTITITNTGDVSLVSVPLVDTYSTQHLAFVSAQPGADDNQDDGALNWSALGPLPPGSSTSVVVQFTAREPTLPIATNRVVALPATPPGYPGVPEQESDALYQILPLAGVGDFVWLDINGNGIQDTNEVGLVNVKLSLFTSNHTLVAVTTSAVNGAYAFLDLRPGSYYIHLEVPSGKKLSPSFQGLDPARDSDFNMFNARTPVFTLAPGEFNETIDAGLNDFLILADTLQVYGADINGMPILVWETGSEYGSAGWRILRETTNDEWVVVSAFVPAEGGPGFGKRYTCPDPDVVFGETHRYRLVEREINGLERDSHPHHVTFSRGRSSDRQASVVAKAGEDLGQEHHRDTTVRVLEAGDAEPVNGIKVSVRESGLYHIDAAQLASVFGVDPSTMVSRSLRMRHLGLDVAHARTPDGGILFYGEALRTTYTDENVYWIVEGQPTLIAEEAVSGSGGVSLPSRMYTRAVERQLDARPDLFEIPSEDIWLWQSIISGYRSTFSTTVNLPGILAHNGGSLRVKLKGASVGVGNGMHGARILLNGVVLGDVSFFGRDRVDATFPVPPGLWFAQSNSLMVTSAPPPGITYDIFYIDGFEFTYERDWVAVSNQLIFTSSQAGDAEIFGFSTNAVTWWDITDRWNPVRRTGHLVTSNASGWSVHIVSTGSGRHLLSGQWLTPARITPWREPGLKQTRHAVDVVVIHGPGLEEGSAALAAHRAAQGLRTLAVSVDAVFNEFNHGIRDPRAIRRFLGYAYRQWRVAPRYVVLLGTGTMDYRDFGGPSRATVPGILDGSPRGVYINDGLFGDVNGDGRQDMAIGRIPAVDASGLANYLDKLFAFEAGGAWRETVVLANDKADQSWNYAVDADALATGVMDRLLHRVDVETMGISNASASLRQTMQSGYEAVFYLGHGSRTRISELGLLTVDHAPQLTNRWQAGFIGAFGCLMGGFDFPGLPGLGDRLLLGTGGASALMGSAALVSHEDGKQLSAWLVDALYTEGTPRLGDAWVAAKNRAVDTEAFPGVQTYQFLGDPAMAVGAPSSPRGGPSTSPLRPAYEEWVEWAFAPAWRDAGLSTAPGDNPDGDAFTNWEEYWSGTDPLNEASELALVYVHRAPDGSIAVTWPSVAGRIYRIERATLPEGPYMIVAPSVPGDPEWNTWHDDQVGNDEFYYRVSVY
ncbi:MAG TPA: C25 family cysteine peptidase, partial [Kiritimatiellia bacterium]|nr:C25 family cysteine peptidase [Kiritimatiellia bacterium]